jgi:hypothetical protein
LGDFFESITRDGFKQNKGQFFTPTPIVNFLLYALQLDNLAMKEYRKRNASGAVYDDPRVAVGPGVLTEL